MFPTKNLQSKYDFNKIQQIAINIKKNYKTSNKIDEKITDKIIEEVKWKLRVFENIECLKVEAYNFLELLFVSWLQEMYYFYRIV